MKLSDIIERIKEVKELQFDYEVAGLLQVEPETLRMWKHRNQIPFEEIREFCKKNKFNYGWIMDGEGRKFSSDVPITSIYPGADSVDSVLHRIKDYAGIESDYGLAKKMKIRQSNIHNWRERGTVPYKKLSEYCNTHKLNINYFLFGEGDPQILDSFTPVRAIEKIPIVSLVGAGDGIFPTDENLYDEWINCPPGLKNHQPFAMRIDGVSNSMMPLLKPGMFIICSKTQKAINGDIAVVKCESGIFVKEVWFTDGKVKLHSYNPEYEDRECEMKDVEFIYPVIWMRRAK